MDVTRYGRVQEQGILLLPGNPANGYGALGYLETFTSVGVKKGLVITTMYGVPSVSITDLTPEQVKAYVQMSDMTRIGRVGEQTLLVISAKEFNKPALIGLETVNEGGDPLTLYLWADGAGNLRANTTIPTLQDEEGVIVIAGGA
jgi:hypothetical protein